MYYNLKYNIFGGSIMNKLSKALILLTSLNLFISTADAASKIAGQTVKIGVLTDMSGPLADLGGPNSVKSVQMAVDDFIAKNKPDFKIEVVSADHQNKADIASSIVREWFDTAGVDAIVDVVNSACGLAVNEITAQKEKVFLATGPATDKLTQESCKPYTIHYGFDTYALASVAAQAVLKLGGKSWFMVTNNFAFGIGLEESARKTVEANGGKIVGTVRHPFETTDFSSFLLQAKESGAEVIGLANSGGGLMNSLKQAHEFGIGKGQRLVTFALQLTDIHSLGLEIASGLMYTEAFVWNRTPESTAWSRRYFEKTQKMPSAIQAAGYSATYNYLEAIQATESKGPAEVVKQMKSKPINDFYATNAQIREDGLLVHDMFLVEVKKPTESKEPWDYLTIKETIPGDKAYEPLSATRCPLVKKN
jgi:branched-chain amino acid transport system substrate-binding protein